MAKIQLLAGSTSNTINLFVQDSSSTVGAGLSGLAYNTSGLTAYYALPRAAPVAITLATQTATGAFSSGGFVELDATHCKGLYRLDIPDAAVASGRFANIYLYGATNMAPVVLEIELTATNNQDAVHGGMSALPNTACTTNASLITSGTGTDQLQVVSGIASGDLKKILATAVSTPATAGILDVNVKNIVNTAAAVDANNLLKVDTEDWKGGVIPAVNVTGVPKVDLVDVLGTAPTAATAGVLDVNVKYINSIITTAVTTVRAFIGSTQDLIFNANNFLKVSLNDILGTTLTETAGQLAAGFKKWFNVASPTSTMNEITLVDTLTTYTGNTPQTGDGYPILSNGSYGNAALESLLNTINTSTGTAIPSLIAALNNISQAQVKTQMVAALSTDTYAEPGQGTPAATASVTGKLGYLYKSLINQYTQTATAFNLFNNAGNIVDQKATVSDDGTTFERTNIISGP